MPGVLGCMLQSASVGHLGTWGVWPGRPVHVSALQYCQGRTASSLLQPQLLPMHRQPPSTHGRGSASPKLGSMPV
jgi:hypothetical protein